MRPNAPGRLPIARNALMLALPAKRRADCSPLQALSPEENVRTEHQVSEYGSPVATPTRRNQIMAVLSGGVAWAFDLFDLFLLLYLAPTIGKLFFPSSIPALSLAGVYGAFAVSVLMRPVGAMVFGPYVDRHGRRKGLMLCFSLLAGISLLLGATPTYIQIGWYGSALFLLFRLVEGVFIGGVVASSHTVATETVRERYRGLVSGAVAGSSGLGSLLASLVYFILTAVFSDLSFAAWGWRVMLWSGVLFSVIAVVIFALSAESPMWSVANKSGSVARTPLRELFGPAYRRTTIRAVMVVVGGGVAYYLTAGYLPTYLTTVNHLAKSQSSVVLLGVAAVQLPGAALAGHMSQLIGRRKSLVATGLVVVVGVFVSYLVLRGMGPHAMGEIWLLSLILSFLGTAASGAFIIWLNELFPTRLRGSGTSFCWNTGFAIGGIMPTIAALLTVPLGTTAALLILIGIAYLVFFAGLLSTRDTVGAMTREYQAPIGAEAGASS